MHKRHLGEVLIFFLYKTNVSYITYIKFKIKWFSKKILHL